MLSAGLNSMKRLGVVESFIASEVGGWECVLLGGRKAGFAVANLGASSTLEIARQTGNVHAADAVKWSVARSLMLA